MIDNKGKLVEAWLCTCFECGKEVVLSWDDGRDMSRSQANHILEGKEYGWQQINGEWTCPECQSEF